MPHKSKRYIMFDFDEINLDITYKSLQRFDEMWNEGCSIAEIAFRLQRTQAEMQLLAIDRFMSKAISPRKGSMEGTKPWCHPNNKIRVEA